MKSYVSITMANDWQARLPAEAWPMVVRALQGDQKILLTMALEGNPVLIRLADVTIAMLVTEEAIARRKEHDLMLDN